MRKNNTSIENLRLRGSELTEQDLRCHEGKTAFLDMEQLGDEGYGSREGTNLNENLITMQTCMSAMTLREEQDEQRSRDTQTSHQKSFERAFHCHWNGKYQTQSSTLQDFGQISFKANPCSLYT